MDPGIKGEKSVISIAKREVLCNHTCTVVVTLLIECAPKALLCDID